MVHAFDAERLAILRNHDDDGESHRCFGRRDDNHEEDEDQPVQLIMRTRKACSIVISNLPI